MLAAIGNNQVRLDGRNRSINRLVAAAFLNDPPSPTAVVRHQDGNRANCAADNLVWALRPKRAHGEWVVFTS